MKYKNIDATRVAGISNLKTVRLGLLTICIYSFFLLSCKRDLVGTASNQPDGFAVVLPEEESTILRGDAAADSIIARVKMPGEAATDFDTTRYSFVWTNFQTKDTLGTKPFLAPDDFKKLEPKLITCLLEVKEKSTGVTRYATTNVFITTPTREGWVLLEEKAGEAKFSMLTYTAQGYKRYTDLSSELGINIPLNGKPVSMNIVGNEKMYEPRVYQWLGVTTDQEIRMIRTMDFVSDTTMSTSLTNILQPGPASPVKLDVCGLSTFVATKDKDVFYINMGQLFLGQGAAAVSRINAYKPPVSATSPRFDASPYHTFTSNNGIRDYSRIMFAEDSGVFVRADKGAYPPGLNGVMPLDFHFSLKGFTLKMITTLKGPEVDEITALVFNPATSETYLLQFLANGLVTNIKSIPFADAGDMMASRFIEIELNAGYLIYQKDHEVRAYDYKLGQTFSLLNLGTETISVIKIIHRYPPTSVLAGRAELYKSILNRLIVCTYDEANPDQSGTFRSYIVPLGHQPPIVDIDETGFPKIVDITFAPIM